LSDTTYIPALKYKRLPKFYDGLLDTFLREQHFKNTLLHQAKNNNPHHIVDVGLRNRNTYADVA
jgi:hypothetical protein